jgi:hypothetical protein
MSHGWWRRNRWGFAGIPLALAVVAGLGWYHASTRERIPDPTVAVAADSTGWAQYGGARIRLITLEQIVPADFAGKPLDLGGLRAWKATLDFKLTAPTDADGCQVELEDRSGRRFGNSPAELDGADLHQDRLCSPDTPEGSAGYQRTMYFVTPVDSVPSGLRLYHATLLPRYAYLAAPVG